MILATATNNESAKKSVNLLPYFGNFDSVFSWNEVSGGTNAIAENNALYPYYGNRCCLINFTDTADEYRFNCGGTQLDTTIKQTKTHRIAFRLRSSNESAVIRFGIEILKSVGGGSPTPVDNIECTAHSDTFGYVNGQYNLFFADFNFDLGDVLSFNFYAQSDIASGTKLHFDGFEVYAIDRVQQYPSIYAPAEPIYIEAEATLDFPSISNNDAHSLTATITGAKVGDYVQVVPPTAVATNTLTYSADVTADNTVTVVVSNVTGGVVDLPSGTYKFFLTRR